MAEVQVVPISYPSWWAVLGPSTIQVPLDVAVPPFAESSHCVKCGELLHEDPDQRVLEYKYVDLPSKARGNGWATIATCTCGQRQLMHNGDV